MDPTTIVVLAIMTWHGADHVNRKPINLSYSPMPNMVVCETIKPIWAQATQIMFQALAEKLGDTEGYTQEAACVEADVPGKT